ncbi:putative peptidoglycan binding domain-containing protein [Candidatus Electrothrix aarhusensis]|uniref:Putative peptidoglycan binding domain-containing protein n=1 Tax=Candidatus Electrothrix aarhusensis TaxID=1859131 RepID=A0A3S3R5T6_9BACT|nr:putative peptidoglycan binding domain-containing protein [Candidatus Electrothrix aarhusensis]
MKNGKALHKIIGCGTVMLAVFAFASTGYSRSSCNTCQSCDQSRYVAPPVVEEYAELQYRDGFPGKRMYKRQQVKKLQCMLSALGYCSGPIDGWYGNSTARGVMLLLADTFQDIGYGKKLTTEHWDYLVNWVGNRCSKYDPQKETYQYRYKYRTPEYQQPQYTTPDYYQYKY